MSRRIKWTARTMQRLRKAVSSYNAAVTRMQKSGLYDVVPNKTSIEREKNLIETRDELYQREKELGRILVKNKADALDVTVKDGLKIPVYLADEIKLAVRAINERRRKIRTKLFGEFEELSNREAATRMANKNIRDVNEEYYTDGEDLDDLFEEKYPKTFQYAEQYKQEWMKYNGDSTVTEIIDWFAENEPDELKAIFESGADEVDIHYIYKVSADKTPVIVRHNNILRFWNNQYLSVRHEDFDGYVNDKYKG